MIQVGLAKTTSVNPNTGVTQSLDRAQPVAMVGRFEWVPDPEVPEPTPVPAIETSKNGDD